MTKRLVHKTALIKLLPLNQLINQKEVLQHQKKASKFSWIINAIDTGTGPHIHEI